MKKLPALLLLALGLLVFAPAPDVEAAQIKIVRAHKKHRRHHKHHHRHHHHKINVNK